MKNKKLQDILFERKGLIKRLWTSSVRGAKGNNSIVSVELNTVKDVNSKFSKYNMVISVIPANDNYTKNNPKNEVVYNKEKDPSQGTSGSMVPSVLNDKPFATIIPNPTEKVNASDEKYLKAVSNGCWHRKAR